jgi:hypothetical protein
MALKGDRNYTDGTDISFFMTATGERGKLVVYSTGGSGAAMDDSTALVAFPTGESLSGVEPAGLLLNDVVNYDLTRQRRNWHQDQVQSGNKVTLLKRGVVVTNMIATGDTPTIGASVYCDTDQGGKLTSTQPTGGVSCGTFLSTKDADGYCKVQITLG